MAIYELVLRGTIWGQQWINRFHYATPLTGTPASDKAAAVTIAFAAQILPSLRSMVSDNGQCTFQDIIVRSLYDPTDFAEMMGMGFNGTRLAADSVSPFVAVAFRTPRLRTGHNRGYKRFCGIGEDLITGNNWIDAANSVSTDVENALGASLDVPDAAPTAEYDPVILFQEFKGLDEKGRRTYGIYDSEVVQRANMEVAGDWQYYRLTTQTSRQAGHGS